MYHLVEMPAPLSTKNRVFYQPQRKFGASRCFYTCLSFHLQGVGRLCMMSLPVWLPGAMLLPGRSLSWGVCVLKGLCPKESLSRRVYVQGVSVQGGLCLGVSVGGGLYQEDYPARDPHPPYEEERVVRIILECILVCNNVFALGISGYELSQITSQQYWTLQKREKSASVDKIKKAFIHEPCGKALNISPIHWKEANCTWIVYCLFPSKIRR